jgi:hypothetical protein
MKNSEGKSYQPIKHRFTIQYILDRLVNHVIIRWSIYSVLMTVYYLRVFFIQKGYYLATYFLAVSTVSLLVRFITPEDPDEVSDILGEMILPGISPAAPHSTPSSIVDDEFRPFMRSLPEFQFWQKAVLYVLIGHIVVSFRIFKITTHPIILIMYFIFFAVLAAYRPVKRFLFFFFLIDFSIIQTGRFPWNF